MIIGLIRDYVYKAIAFSNSSQNICLRTSVRRDKIDCTNHSRKRSCSVLLWNEKRTNSQPFSVCEGGGWFTPECPAPTGRI